MKLDFSFFPVFLHPSSLARAHHEVLCANPHLAGSLFIYKAMQVSLMPIHTCTSHIIIIIIIHIHIVSSYFTYVHTYTHSNHELFFFGDHTTTMAAENRSSDPHPFLSPLSSHIKQESRAVQLLVTEEVSNAD